MPTLVAFAKVGFRMDVCRVDGCTKSVSKAGYHFCYDHWKAEKTGQVKQCDRCGKWHASAGQRCAHCDTGSPDEVPSDSAYLSSTRIGEHFGLSSVKVNLVLAELGWIEKYVRGWVPTERGNAYGANIREMKNGTPYVVWPAKVLVEKALLASMAEQSTNKPRQQAAAKPAAKDAGDFRTKFEANFITSDGHRVRSRAEAMIDNFLYMQKIVHAYERRLPIEEDCYCDFYLPTSGGGVYIEYWGLEADARYRDRKAAKQAIYAKHNLRLIELGDAEIERLDDVLPRMLLKFGIESA